MGRPAVDGAPVRPAPADVRLARGSGAQLLGVGPDGQLRAIVHEVEDGLVVHFHG